MKKNLPGLVAVLFGAAAFAGPEPQFQPPNLAVEIDAPGAVRAEIEISIPSLKEVQRYELKVTNRGLVGGVYVPPGEENQISVTALDAKGEKVYWGSRHIRVDSKYNPQIEIALEGRESKDPPTAKFGTHRFGLAIAASEGDGLMLEATLFDAAGKHVPFKPEELTWHGLPEKFEVVPYSCFDNSLCWELPDLTVYEALMSCMREKCAKPIDSRGPYRYVAVGRSHTCALTISDDIVCWGDNRAGQLRSSPTTCTTGTWPSDCSPYPLPIVCGAGEVCKFHSLSAGGERTCAVDTDGKAWCWGTHADISTGEVERPSRALQVNGEIKAVDAGGQNVRFTSIDVDLTDACAISTLRELYCWRGPQMSLDDSDVHNKGTQYKTVSVGKRHACAQKFNGVMRNGKIDCFGSDFDGQVTGHFPVPGPINQVLQEIFNRGGHIPAAGATSSCAQDVDENTICWGSPETHVGLSSATGGFIALWRSYATTMASNSDSCHVGMGNFFTCTRTCLTGLGGDLFCGNWRSSLPLRELSKVTEPVDDYLISWTQVDVGPNHVCAVTTQRDIWCFGTNASGEFGTGTTSGGRTDEPIVATRRNYNLIETPIFP